MDLSQDEAFRLQGAQRVIWCVLPALFSAGLAALGADDLLISSFKNGNYTGTVLLGTEAIKQNPRNATARYYMAEALTKLNRRPEALAQYSECQKVATDARMIDFCRQAIASLSSQPNSRTAVPGEPKSAVLAAPAEAKSAAPVTPTAGELQMLERKANFIQQGITEIEFLRKQTDEKIGRVKEDAAAVLRDIPQTIYTFRHPIANPEYTETADRLRRESADKISVINAEFDKRQAEITTEYKKRADACGTVQDGFISQQKAGTSLIQMTPQNSNAYVRNFVNYDGYKPPPPPVALKAGEAKLLPQANPVKSDSDSSVHGK